MNKYKRVVEVKSRDKENWQYAQGAQKNQIGSAVLQYTRLERKEMEGEVMAIMYYSCAGMEQGWLGEGREHC